MNEVFKVEEDKFSSLIDESLLKTAYNKGYNSTPKTLKKQKKMNR